MATQKANEQDNSNNWLFPLGVLGVVLLLAVQFVKDDPTTNVVQLALLGAVFALVWWGYTLKKQNKEGEQRVLRDRLMLALGLAGALGYCNFGNLHFGIFIHTWDTYHYYMGAKYFREVKYDLLYDCAAVADSEVPGLYEQTKNRTMTDLRTNIMLKAGEVLQHPEVCKSNFSPERWESFKKDLNFFRSRVNPVRWAEIHQDHGYNATPVWTLAGWALTNTSPATLTSVLVLDLLDPLYLILMGVMLYWAFGPRIFALGMIVLGCNFPGRFYWTGGAFLRHDWLFYTVAVVCLLKKEKYFLAGLSLAYATLLRLFPGLMVIGPALAGLYLYLQTKKLDRKWLRFVAGGAVGVAVLFPASLVLGGGIDTWAKFAQNTSKHAATPLTNHMGLRTVMSYRPDTRGVFLKEGNVIDGWQTWKTTRYLKYLEARPLFFLLLAALAYLIWLAVKQTQGELWVAASLGIGYIVAGAELTCYYYVFLVGMAPLQEKRREVALVLCSALAICLLVNLHPLPGMSIWLDDQYTAMSIACLAGVVGVWWLFTKKGTELSIEPEPAPELGLGPVLAVAGGAPVSATPADAPADDRKKKKKKRK